MTQNIMGACVMCDQNGVHRDCIYFPFLFPFNGKPETLKQRLKTAVNLDLRMPMEPLTLPHMTQNIRGACVMCGLNGVRRDHI